MRFEINAGRNRGTMIAEQEFVSDLLRTFIFEDS